jgi:peptidoglycan hydrolase CwlO-like protein
MLEKQKTILIICIAMILGLGNFSSAQAEDFDSLCGDSNVELQEQNFQKGELSREEYEDFLRQCINHFDEYYGEIESSYQSDLSEVREKKGTLESELRYLRGKISGLSAQITQSNLVVGNLKLQLQDTESSIGLTERRINDYRIQLADVIQSVYEEERISILGIIFSGGSISSVFREIVALETLSTQVRDLLDGAEKLESYLADQHVSMEEEKVGIEREIVYQDYQRENLQSTRKTKDVLLTKTEGQEDLYQEELAKVQKEAEEKVGELKNKLFNLFDASREITEYEAIEIAGWAADKTGIQPAFLLAIVEQESALGNNVGQCYLTNLKTGDGVDVWGNKRPKIMKATPRSWENNANTNDFSAITEQLGLEWKDTPVSCPLSYGYGGAMGPAQFIPSTWMLYKRKVEQNLGGSLASPWVPEHAFLAAALYLVDLGADGTWRGQYNAAAKYYGQAGSYCRQVLNRIPKWEEKIKSVELTKNK